jgi:hypothetical protein
MLGNPILIQNLLFEHFGNYFQQIDKGIVFVWV